MSQTDSSLHNQAQMQCLTVFTIWAAGNLMLSIDQFCDRAVTRSYGLQLILILMVDRLTTTTKTTTLRWLLILIIAHVVALISASTLYKLAVAFQSLPVALTSDDVCMALNPFIVF
jgi:hypothetical protein